MNAIDRIPTSPVGRTGHRLTTSPSRLQQEALSTNADDPEKIHRSCQDMESLFLKQLLQEMRKSVPDSGSGGFGGQKKMFSELIDTEFSKKLAEKGIGLAGMLEARLMQQLRIEHPDDEQGCRPETV